MFTCVDFAAVIMMIILVKKNNQMHEDGVQRGECIDDDVSSSLSVSSVLLDSHIVCQTDRTILELLILVVVVLV